MSDEVDIASIRQALDQLLPDHEGKVKTSFPTTVTSVNEDNENPLRDIFTKIQNDIDSLKTKVLSCLASKNPPDHEEIKKMFEKTEENLERQRVEAEFYNLMNRPAIIPLEKVFGEESSILEEEDLSNIPPIDFSMIKELEKTIATPGERARAMEELKNIIDPLRADNRKALEKHYGIPAPQEISNVQKRVLKSPPRKLKPIEKEEKRKVSIKKDMNMLKLKSPKKEIKPISPSKSPSSSHLPIKPRPMVLHEPTEKKLTSKTDKKPVHNLALVRFDEKASDSAINPRNNKGVDKMKGLSMKENDEVNCVQQSEKDHIGGLLSSSSQELRLLHDEQLKHFLNFEGKDDKMIVPVPSPSLDTQGAHKFTIENGKTRDDNQEFVNFKQHYLHIYESIYLLLRKLERLMKDYSVPIAFIDGDRLVDVALYFGVGSLKPTIKDLLVPVINSDDVQRIIKIPGRRYISSDGKDQAAIKLQSTWRRYRKRRAYLEYRRKKWAAGLIALTWIMKCKMTLIRKVMKTNQAKYLQDFRNKAKIFSDNWSKIKDSKRLVIHIPSLGYSSSIRQNSSDISVLENHQIGRIFDVLDEDTQVIFISPVNMGEQLERYYFRLLQVMCEVSCKDYEKVKEKLKFITPDAVGKFPEHHFCTSTMIKYSTNTIRRLKELIKGKQAYIIPSIVSSDDLYIAQKLNLPILGSEPDLVSLYSLKSGVRRIFNTAGVKRPPGEYDIYSMHQLHESLARLVTENLHIKRWIFKIDNEFDGRGTAYCDVTPHLKCYQHALCEQEKYGEKWSQKWANENVYNVILEEIPMIIEKHAKTVDESVYEDWDKFVDAFLRQGGIVEASPPSDSITGLTSHVLIEPDGNVNILATTDQVHSTSPYKCFGYTLPQSSINADTVNNATDAIAQACRQRGLIGHVSIDFVTFICPKSREQDLWAVGLFIGYSSGYAMLRMVTALTNGVLDVRENTFSVSSHDHITNNIFYRSRRRKTLPSQELVVETKPRFCVYSSKLLHTNLSNVQYNVFFQLCKAKGIAYDEKMKLGTSFSIFDEMRRNSIGMITIGENLHEAVSLFALNLQLIHSDISSTQMPGQHNFTGAVGDLKGILSSLQENKQLQQEDYPTASPTFKKYQDSCHEVLRDVMTPTRHECTSPSTSSDVSHLSTSKQNNLLLNDGSEIFDHRLPSSPVSDLSLFPK